MTTPLEAAWLAGIFEGEGSFGLTVSKRNETWTYLTLKICMTDEDIINRIALVTGCERIHKSDRFGYGNRKTIYNWSVGARDELEKVISLIEPWLGERRKKRLAELRARTSKYRRMPKRKTICSRGHLLKGYNAKSNGKNKVTCRMCNNALARERRRIKREDKLPSQCKLNKPE